MTDKKINPYDTVVESSLSIKKKIGDVDIEIQKRKGNGLEKAEIWFRDSAGKLEPFGLFDLQDIKNLNNFFAESYDLILKMHGE